MKQPIKIDYDLRNQLNDSLHMPLECYQCGSCTANCSLNSIRENKITIRKIFHQAQIGVKPDKLVWDCASCKFCEIRCPRQVDIVDTINELRKHAYRRREIPQEFEPLLWNILEDGNPFGESQSLRFNWAKNLEVSTDLSDKDVLLYIGCANSYDPRLQKVVRSLVNILKKGNINFGLLGNLERCSGEAIIPTGEEHYLDVLIQDNVDEFNKYDISKIVTVSPHSFDIFKRLYPEFGLNIEVQHYTQLIQDLIDKSKIQLFKTEFSQVTYHDPCYLSRYHGIIDEPRNIISSIPNIDLVEMKNTKSNSICCGGGGGQIFRDIEQDNRISNLRIKEAHATNSEAILTSCPYCIQNFEDSIKVNQNSLVINDIIELVAKSMKLEVK